jgi:hypothetical protein
VDWRPWGSDVFEIARQLDKPILLDIGAVWCHWCHVIDVESYENEATAEIINNEFVAVKVDRDERPDVDTRYQAAVSAISGQGGWPLTAFLLPDGQTFFGGTYFPPEDRNGRPGFPRVLKLVAEAYRTEREKLLSNANQIRRALEPSLTKPNVSGTLDNISVNDNVRLILSIFDQAHGGFGIAPKFPHPNAIELLLRLYSDRREERLLEVSDKTLRSMANGGVYDQLGGGFHRYSTDEKWIVPHFEKMLYDNAPLLLNFVHAYQITNDEFFRSVALNIVRYVNEVLTDPKLAGFYNSQDADVDLGDDGSYYTWTLAETQSVLSGDELQIARLHYNVNEQGEMPHDASQNVLFIDKSVEEISAILEFPQSEVRELLQSAKQKLLTTRNNRKPPFVDRSIYASWNGMMIAAYLGAAKVFHEDAIGEFAIRSLDRILHEHAMQNGSISHVAQSSSYFLDDQVQIGWATLAAFEHTADLRYLEKTVHLVDSTIENFWDEGIGGFFDIPKNSIKYGALNLPVKPIHDAPTASANAVAIRLLSKLSGLTGNVRYRNLAEEALSFFSRDVKGHGISTASYSLALHEYLHPPVNVFIVSKNGSDSTRLLKQTALEHATVGSGIYVFSNADAGRVPPTVLSMIKHREKTEAFLCAGFSCSPPASTPEELRIAMTTYSV